MKITEVSEMETSSTDNLDETLTALQENLINLIKNKIFLGRYSDRRYVESLQMYRDIIIVESTEDIASSLHLVKKTLEPYAKNKWLGITGDPQNEDSSDIFLWVQLDNVPIGKSWFQLSAVTFELKEIMFEIQYVQPFRSPSKSLISNDPDFPSFDLKEIFTYKNMYEAVKFCVILIMVLFTFSVEALRFLGEYSIRLGYVIVHFMHVSTPVWLGFIQFLTKCVGGFYWLIYMMFRGTPNDPVVPKTLMDNNQKQIGYYSPTYRRSEEYRLSDHSNSRLNYLDNSRQSWDKYKRQS